MSFGIRLWLVMLLGVALSGCVPSDQDEEKEPHYVLGLSRINAMDYQGAVEAFEESLEVNPHSAAAHYQLAMLYENQESDPAAAIYHYEQYLKYDPTAENADIIRQRIGSCKQQLAQDVMGMSSSPQAQQQLETVVEQNRQLQQQVNTLQASLKQWGDWYTTYSNQLAAARDNATTPAAQNNYIAQQSPTPVQQNPTPTQQPVVTPVNPVTPHTDTPTAATGGRTHVVQHGETAMAICRQYGIKLNDLKTANPTVNAARLRIGEVLNIP